MTDLNPREWFRTADRAFYAAVSGDHTGEETVSMHVGQMARGDHGLGQRLVGIPVEVLIDLVAIAVNTLGYAAQELWSALRGQGHCQRAANP